jgi:hypothetical protein
MGRWRSVAAIMAVLALFIAPAMTGCSSSDDGGTATVLLETDVTVPAGGGSATVFFQGASGQRVRITLSGPASTQPYGYLEPPGGTASYTPPNSGSSGSNEAEVDLAVTGQFSLTIFDGANAGGVISVKVALL